MGKSLSGNLPEGRHFQNLRHESIERSRPLYAHLLYFSTNTGVGKFDVDYHPNRLVGLQGQLSHGLEKFLDGMVSGSCSDVRGHAQTQENSMDGLFEFLLHVHLVHYQRIDEIHDGK